MSSKPSAHVAVLVLGQVGRAQQGVDGGASHPGQRGGGVDGDAAPRVPQAAALAPLLLPAAAAPASLCRCAAAELADSTEALGSAGSIAGICWSSLDSQAASLYRLAKARARRPQKGQT